MIYIFLSQSTFFSRIPQIEIYDKYLNLSSEVNFKYGKACFKNESLSPDKFSFV